MSVFQTNAINLIYRNKHRTHFAWNINALPCTAFTAIITASTNSPIFLFQGRASILYLEPNILYQEHLQQNSGHNLPLCLFSVFMKIVYFCLRFFLRAQCAFFFFPLGLEQLIDFLYFLDHFSKTTSAIFIMLFCTCS